ncbi:hypothetical protein DHODJN_25530 [Methylorubrum extorquens]
MIWRPDDGSWNEEMLARFVQVEPGNYFSDQIVPATDPIVGHALIEFLNQHLHGSSLR